MATGVDTLNDRRINLYEVLQVSPKASAEVVQAAYRALARAYHPDVNPSPEAARQMRQVNAAYSVLSDPRRRARYDSVRLRPMRARREIDPNPPVSTIPRPTPRPSYVRAVPNATVTHLPRSSGPRMGRVLGTLTFVCLLICGLVYGLYLVAGILEDEPLRAMTPNAAEVSQVIDAAPSVGR